jgi:hypothetical protein
MISDIAPLLGNKQTIGDQAENDATDPVSEVVVHKIESLDRCPTFFRPRHSR